MAMRQCVCGNNDSKNWKFGFNDNTRKVTAICKQCGIIIEFNAKKRKQRPETEIGTGAKAEYEIRNGKHFLKIDGIFKEVEICKVNSKGQRDKNSKSIKVMPIQ